VWLPEGRRFWKPVICHNLEWRVAAGDWVLRLDSDILLSPDFVQRHAPASRVFWAGDWRAAPKDQPNKQSLSGILFANRDDLRMVNGYSERHEGYGFDDDDLYARLDRHRMWQTVDLDAADHIPHGNRERLENLPEWNGIAKAARDRKDRMWRNYHLEESGKVEYEPERQAAIDANKIRGEKQPWTVEDRMEVWWVSPTRFEDGGTRGLKVADAIPYAEGLRQGIHERHYRLVA
jgi:hypothetical protein